MEGALLLRKPHFRSATHQPRGCGQDSQYLQTPVCLYKNRYNDTYSMSQNCYKDQMKKMYVNVFYYGRKFVEMRSGSSLESSSLWVFKLQIAYYTSVLPCKTTIFSQRIQGSDHRTPHTRSTWLSKSDPVQTCVSRAGTVKKPGALEF